MAISSVLKDNCKFYFAFKTTLACSKRSDNGERCEVKKVVKSRGGLGRASAFSYFKHGLLI